MDSCIVIPDCIRAAIEDYRWTPARGGESGGTVYRLDKRDGPALYLKCGTGNIADGIAAEMVRLQWLAKFLPVPRIHQFFYSADQAYLLTTALSGRSAQECLAADPGGRSAIVWTLAEFLRGLHSLPLVDCPFNSDHCLRMADARRNLESGRVAEWDFDSDHEGWTSEQVWREMQALLPLEFGRVVTHGDFSLGNIFLEGGRVTGCIDVGRLGVADPYQDLAILSHNLEEFGADLQNTLFRAYGIADPDARKIRYHLCLDEFF